MTSSGVGDAERGQLGCSLVGCVGGCRAVVMMVLVIVMVNRGATVGICHPRGHCQSGMPGWTINMPCQDFCGATFWWVLLSS